MVQAVESLPSKCNSTKPKFKPQYWEEKKKKTPKNDELTRCLAHRRLPINPG
jgi:hypothetical protein